MPGAAAKRQFDASGNRKFHWLRRAPGNTARCPPVKFRHSNPAPATAAIVDGWNSFRHQVTNAAHILDEIAAQLLAQGMNVDLDGIAFDAVIPAVEFFFQ